MITRTVKLNTVAPGGLLRSSLSLASSDLAPGNYTATFDLGPAPALNCQAQTSFDIRSSLQVYLPLIARPSAKTGGELPRIAR